MAHVLPAPLFALLILGSACLSGCVGELPERRAVEDPGAEMELPPQRVKTLNGALGLTLPGSMIVHRFDSAILASNPGGEFRLSVTAQEQQPLLVGAGRGKETLLARGWVVEGEQHYEKAILARFRKGGNASRPKHRRETWWIQDYGSNLACDGIATREGFGLLGDDLRAICTSVTIHRSPEPVTRPSTP